MIIRMLGACLVLAACGGAGIGFARQLRVRLAMLEDIRKAITLLRGQILYANATLEEAFTQTGRRLESVIGQLFLVVGGRIEAQNGEPFAQMWAEEADKLSAEMAISVKEQEDLKGLGEHLGYLDRDMQERTLNLYLEQLDLSIDALRKSLDGKMRLSASMGILCGLFIVIVMI